MGHQKDQVIGVFLDESHAQQAIQSLQSAGFKARIADKSAIREFRDVGLEDDVMNLYENRYSEGNTIVIVNAKNRGEDALGIMMQNGAEYMDLSGKKGTGASVKGEAYDAKYYQKLDRSQRQYGQIDTKTGLGKTEDEVRVQLREEALVPTKQARQAGEVEVRKTVREEQREVPVNLTHEEVRIERRAVDRPLKEGEIGELKDEVIRVPVYEEQAQLHKQGRVAEEVVIGKEAVEEQQTLTGTVRREEIDVDTIGEVRREETDTDIHTRRTDSEGYTNP